MVEYRETFRFNTDLRSAYNLKDKTKNSFCDCRCKDISTKGAKLTLDRSFEIGQEIQVRLNLPRFLNPVLVLAKVIWQKQIKQEGVYGYATGVYFTRIKDRDRTNIFDFLKETCPEEILKQWWDGV